MLVLISDIYIYIYIYMFGDKIASHNSKSDLVVINELFSHSSDKSLSEAPEVNLVNHALPIHPKCFMLP